MDRFCLVVPMTGSPLDGFLVAFEKKAESTGGYIIFYRSSVPLEHMTFFWGLSITIQLVSL